MIKKKNALFVQTLPLMKFEKWTDQHDMSMGQRKRSEFPTDLDSSYDFDSADPGSAYIYNVV